MKKYIVGFICILSFLCKTGNCQQADERIGELINHSDWFTLEQEYPELKKHSQLPFLQYLAESLLYNSFNEPDQALAAIDSLLTNHQEEIGFENTMNMLLLYNDILKQKGEYKKVKEKLTQVIEDITPHIDPANFPHLNFLAKVTTCFQEHKPPLLTRPAGDIEISCIIQEVKVDTILAGHQLMIMGKINGKSQKFIVDTGAEYTFLMEKIARENQVRFLCDSMPITGAVAKGTGTFGITDRLEMEDIIYENIFTIIAPPNEEVDTIIQLEAVLGRDFLTAMGEMIIYPQEQKIVFPEKFTPLPATGRNMMIDGGQPWVLAYTNGEKIILHLDTGAASGGLNSLLYK